MTLQELKDQKAAYDQYGSMILSAEVINFLFDTAIAAQEPAPVIGEPVPEPKRTRKKGE